MPPDELCSVGYEAFTNGSKAKTASTSGRLPEDGSARRIALIAAKSIGIRTCPRSAVVKLLDLFRWVFRGREVWEVLACSG